MKRASPLLVIALFLAGFFIVPVGVTSTPARLQETLPQNETLEHLSEPSWLPADKTVRIAIYNETNTTDPSYASHPGVEHNNASGLRDILLSYGYEATLLNAKDISSHELITAKYDVLALVDNFPRENITNQIQEFWLGGGSLLALDGSAAFLCYFGILPPESAGSDGYSVYWNYNGDDINVTARHPVTKGYEKNQTINTMSGYLAWNWTALQGTSIASDLTMLAKSNDDPNDVTALAFEPTSRGGKVVTIAPDNHNDYLSIELGQMVADGVEWLCPRPKGRILFDVSHDNYYPVDTWDPTGYSIQPRFTPLRDALVNRTYTFDKLWPSSTGNFTEENLAPYDMLILNTPKHNFTSSEVTALSNWVSAGGGLFAMGESVGSFLQENQNINYLLADYDLWMNITANFNPSIFTTTTLADHPTVENVNELSFSGGCYVNSTGTAYPLVMQGSDTLVASQEIGAGRIMLAGDINYLANYIEESDNAAYAVNVANWLVSWGADTILYTDEPDSASYYRTPVASALNELGMDFYLVFRAEYLNLSLHQKAWDLIVVDNPWFSIDVAYDAIYEHVEGGGRFVMSSYYVDSYPSEPLWPLLGFQFIEEMPDDPELYIWDSSHPIFTDPYDYSAANFTPTRDYGDEGDVLGVYPNATALGGNSSSYDVNHSTIVLGNDGRTLYNGYLIDQFQDDLDDSTYPDNFELWLNEIAFIMRPTIDSPSDMSIEAFDTGESITWTPTSDRPHLYKIERNSVEVESGSWGGGQITYDLEEDSLELVTFELTVYDVTGSYASDIVMVTVVDTTNPSLVEAPDNLEYEEGTTEHFVNWSFTEDLPDSWVFYINGTVEDSGAWDGSEISVDAGGLSVGVWNLTIAVNDTSDNVATSTVYLNVT
ncbi:MAG: hypothetical protein R6V83_13725, partial [Candidatus Thorarchaeota archaeon]